MLQIRPSQERVPANASPQGPAQEEASPVQPAGSGTFSACWLQPRPADGTLVGQLSNEALLYGALHVGLDDSTSLAMRLYRFNTLPLTRSWSTTLPDRTSLLKWLKLTSRDPWVGAMEREYMPYGDASSGAFWMRWKHRSMGALDGSRYKLYISPQPHHLPAVFSEVVRICVRMAVPAFKIGSGASGILRPDKFVMHFPTQEGLERVAREIRFALRGVPAQGVPFSRSFNDEGSLSIGEDPPDHVQAMRPFASSWRLFITERIASSLHGSKANEARTRVSSALACLENEGIDTEKWCMRKSW